MDIFNRSMLDKESSNDIYSAAAAVVENITFMDSSIEPDDLQSNMNGFDLHNSKTVIPNVHTPSPMVARSYFNEHKEPWKNIPIYSYSDKPNTWITYQQSYSPELKRDTDIIFEEKIVNDGNEEMESDYVPEEAHSPDNSISSNDSTSSSGSSSSDSSTDDSHVSDSQNNVETVQTYNRSSSSEDGRDFQQIFSGIAADDDLSGMVRYHQPPKALDRDAARRLARRLYECDGFKITDVAKHLSKRNDFSQIVGEEFANHFDLKGLRLDRALRLFLGRFTLTGETQERERIMHHFSRRFVCCNEGLYNGEDACHTLVCALIILNTNLHSQSQPKMTCNDFLLNLKELNEGDNFPPENLMELYEAIEQEPIRWPMDEELVGIVSVPKQQQQELLLDFSKHHLQQQQHHQQMLLLSGGQGPYGPGVGLDLPRDSCSRDFMSGYLVRKWLKEPGGKKAAFGRRGWKLFYGRLRDLTLYLYKDHDKSVSAARQAGKPTRSASMIGRCRRKAGNGKEVRVNGDDQGPREVAKDPSPGNATEDTAPTTPPPAPPQAPASLVLPPADSELHISHAYASRAHDYVKKRHVFRIRTKYGSEYLFQVNTDKEVDGWVDTVNYVAALLSEPEPTIGVGTMQRLSATTVPPVRVTSLSVRDQLDSHQRCVLELERAVRALREDGDGLGGGRRARAEWEEAVRFREDELQRYKVYCQLLELELLRSQNVVGIRLEGGGPGGTFFYQPYGLPCGPGEGGKVLAGGRPRLLGGPLTASGGRRLRYRGVPGQPGVPLPPAAATPPSEGPPDVPETVPPPATFYEIV